MLFNIHDRTTHTTSLLRTVGAYHQPFFFVTRGHASTITICTRVCTSFYLYFLHDFLPRILIRILILLFLVRSIPIIIFLACP